jgi:hypothetical protein
MGETPGEPPTQSEAETCPGGRDRRAVLMSGLAELRHAHRMSAASPLTNGPCVLKKQYRCTATETALDLDANRLTVLSY